MFISIKSILPRFLNKVDKKSEIYNLSTVDIFNKLLEKEWGVDIVGFVSVEKYRDGNLFVKCSNSSVASEVQLKKNYILNKINSQLNYLKRREVDNIIFI